MAIKFFMAVVIAAIGVVGFHTWGYPEDYFLSLEQVYMLRGMTMGALMGVIVGTFR